VAAAPDPRVIAEDAQAYLLPRASTVREDQGDLVVRHVPISPQYWYGSATRPRFSDGAADRRIAETRAWFAARGRAEFMWMFGESATPTDLRARLEQSGAIPDPEDPISEAMVLSQEPPAGPAGMQIGRLKSFEDFRDSMWITLAEADPETWARTEENLPAAWEEARTDDKMFSFLARIDGQPIAMAQLVWLSNGLPYLGGATTLREHRGRGAFRALVRARWDEVVRQGMPVLLVQAGQHSAPILRSLGFESTGKVFIYRDRSANET
jgi:hypothetical protein